MVSASPRYKARLFVNSALEMFKLLEQLECLHFHVLYNLSIL